MVPPLARRYRQKFWIIHHPRDKKFLIFLPRRQGSHDIQGGLKAKGIDIIATIIIHELCERKNKTKRLSIY
jgi:hypothetical protein